MFKYHEHHHHILHFMSLCHSLNDFIPQLENKDPISNYASLLKVWKFLKKEV